MKKQLPTRAAKPRALNEAKANLNRFELDTTDIVLAVVNQDDDIPENLVYEIDMSEYAEKYGLKYDRNSRLKARKCVAAITQKGHMALGILKEDGTYKSMVIFQTIEIDSDSRMLKVKLGEDFKALLVEIKESKEKGITFYDIKYTLSMKHVYSKRLYPMLLEWKSTGERIDKFSDLCEKLQIPKGYNTGKITTGILDVAVSEINAITDIHVSYCLTYKSVKGGKKISGIKWVIKTKTKQLSESEVTARIWAESLIKYPAVTAKYTLTLDDGMAITRVAIKSKLSEQDMKKRVLYVIQKPNTKDLVSYCIYMMRPTIKLSPAERNSFNNFDQRDYDFDELERQLLTRSFSGEE